jgi:hypothetical protein
VKIVKKRGSKSELSEEAKNRVRMKSEHNLTDNWRFAIKKQIFFYKEKKVN